MHGLTSSYRRKLATFFVVLYAFCVLAPHAAMALSHGSMAAHCLTETTMAPHSHGQSAAHVHQDGVSHDHSQTSSTKPGKADDQQTACCGLFFMSALAADSHRLPLHELHRGAVRADLPDFLTGNPPGNINRPPIA